MFGDPSRTTRLVCQSCHGRVTIPIAFRRALGIAEAQVLEMTLVQGELRIRQVVMPSVAMSQSNRRREDDGSTTGEDPSTHTGMREDPGHRDPLV